MDDGATALLRRAARAAGLDASGLQVRDRTTAALPGEVVAVVARTPAEVAVARHRAAVSRWLEAEGVPASRLANLDGEAVAPVDAGEGVVTFWHALPPHRRGTHLEIAGALRRLHALAVLRRPALGPLDPLRHVEQRLSDSPLIDEDDRAALLARLDRSREAWARLPRGLPHTPVHGDAWAGNVVTILAEGAGRDGPVPSFPPGTTVLRDLERVSVGPPEWDLVATALSRTTLGELSEDQYREFSDLYGHDVRAWEGYDVMRDARELRMVAYALSAAEDDPTITDQARARVRDCLRAQRPWPGWRAL